MPYMNRWRREWLMSSFYGVSKKVINLHKDYDSRGYTLDTPRRRREGIDLNKLAEPAGRWEHGQWYDTRPL